MSRFSLRDEKEKGWKWFSFVFISVYGARAREIGIQWKIIKSDVAVGGKSQWWKSLSVSPSLRFIIFIQFRLVPRIGSGPNWHWRANGNRRKSSFRYSISGNIREIETFWLRSVVFRCQGRRSGRSCQFVFKSFKENTRKCHFQARFRTWKVFSTF